MGLRRGAAVGRAVRDHAAGPERLAAPRGLPGRDPFVPPRLQGEATARGDRRGEAARADGARAEGRDLGLRGGGGRGDAGDRGGAKRIANRLDSGYSRLCTIPWL